MRNGKDGIVTVAVVEVGIKRQVEDGKGNGQMLSRLKLAATEGRRKRGNRKAVVSRLSLEAEWKGGKRREPRKEKKEKNKTQQKRKRKEERKKRSIEGTPWTLIS